MKTLGARSFSGQPACVRILVSKRDCGASTGYRAAMRVDNVDEFPGHITCDSASRSEIVIPLIKNGVWFGVFAVDSPNLKRFDPDNEDGLERLAASFIQLTTVPMLQG